jgi:hypothetical protein
MSIVRCELPHPLFLVLTPRCLEKTTEDYPGLPFPQNAAEVEADFLAAENGVLALVDEKQADNPKISFCTPRYELVCGLTQQRDAWYAIRLSPLGLRTHNQLARGAARVAPQTWSVLSSLEELNQSGGGTETGLEAILTAWRQSRAPAPLPAESELSPAAQTFLANMDTLIELACEVELEQAARQEKTVIRSAQAESAQVWRFALRGPSPFRVGEYLQVGNGDTAGFAEGVVAESRGDSLLVRFYKPVDSRQIQQARWLAPKISTRQYAIQHEAVNALRNGQSLNPRLLPILLENRYADYPAPVISDATDRPNPAQRTMIERALLVPDLLLALGPPGTGKTDTIREIVARQAALGKKVLVTSKNNKAVDNVLAGLEGVRALRIGREEVVAPETRALLVDRQAGEVRAGILANIAPVQAQMDGLESRWPDIQRAFAGLSELTAAWKRARAALEEQRAQLTNWQTAAYVRVEQALRRQEKITRQWNAELLALTQQAEALEGQLTALRRWSEIPVIGGFVLLWADGIAQNWRETSRAHQQALQNLRKSMQAGRQVWESYRQFVTASEQALAFKRAIAEAESQADLGREAIASALAELSELSRGLPEAPKPPSQAAPEALEALFGEWQAWHAQQASRRALLAEWRDMLQTRPQALFPPLIRSADVVGATCIGVATDARFEDLEFDLVIADEAGQIPVTDLLVPLTRARRAVLVGDHLQLPPVVESELVEKIRAREPENQEIGAWLETSLFERLILRPETPESHKVMLDTQYRMPRPIADFISAQFYGGRYKTGLEKPHEDPFFAHPLVFIDTMKEVRHYEQRAEDGQGYFNPTEARILADLLLAYQKESVEAGVIVPYRKQAEVIRRELRQRGCGWSEDALISRIATVDSFQGRELDVVLFGFTRSNAEGRIGFLAELRRLNVSLTRARRQLAMVGDSVTLSNAAEPAPAYLGTSFARLFLALLVNVKARPGAYLTSHELTRMLNNSKVPDVPRKAA